MASVQLKSKKSKGRVSRTPRRDQAQRTMPFGKRAAKKNRSASADTPLLPQITESEVETYDWIRTTLRDLGWVVKNPSLGTGGQVWTQNQCLAHPEIKRCLGLTRPENVIQLTETKLWVIEGKNSPTKLGLALREAEKDYAEKINHGGRLTVALISGVAGNDNSGYEVRTRMLIDGEYQPVTMNGRETTGLLDPKTVNHLLVAGTPNIADLIIDKKAFLKTAETINKALHAGGINRNDRARVMGALLLAESGDTKTVAELDPDLMVVIEDINTRTRAALRKHRKEQFHPFVRIEPPTSNENHVKFRMALVQTIQALKNLNIKSAMNSGTDVLGEFYEVFLKYGNPAKEIGIVLTPRHVTKFAVETLGVGPQDLVYDCACGTGGFLVAAFDQMRKVSSKAQVERFKKFNLFGVERDPSVAVLAIVNMIFRGDGKNNIIEGSCFSKFLVEANEDGVPTAKYISTPPPADQEPITRVFMNPPFALKPTDEREFGFVDAALKSMATGGLLFTIVPMSVMAEGQRYLTWRRDQLLPHHTVLSVISFPEELFYPVSNQTVAVVIRKGIPHRADQPVLWGRVVTDGFQKSKGKRLPAPESVPNDLARIAPILRSFLANPTQPIKGVPEFVCTVPIDFNDPIMELIPEAYLESAVPDDMALTVRLDAQVKDAVASYVSVDLRHSSLGQDTIIDAAKGAKEKTIDPATIKKPRFGLVALESIFDLSAGQYHSLGEVDSGSVPIVSCGEMRNGIVGFYDVPAEDRYRDVMTVAFNGRPLTAKIHPYEFGAKDDVAVALPKTELPPEALIFIQAALNHERWRFSYYRKCFREKLRSIKLELPVLPNGGLDIEFMRSMVRSQRYWWFLAPRLTKWNPTRPVEAETAAESAA